MRERRMSDTGIGRGCNSTSTTSHPGSCGAGGSVRVLHALRGFHSQALEREVKLINTQMALFPSDCLQDHANESWQ